MACCELVENRRKARVHDVFGDCLLFLVWLCGFFVAFFLSSLVFLVLSLQMSPIGVLKFLYCINPATFRINAHYIVCTYDVNNTYDTGE